MQVFEKTSAEGGRLHASIDRADALPADNTAWAILPRRARQKVTLVTPGNLFLEKVFEAIPLVDLEVVKVSKDAPPDKEAAKALGKSAARQLAPQRARAGISVFHHKVPDVAAAGQRPGHRARAIGAALGAGRADPQPARRQARQRLAADDAHPARQRADARSAKAHAAGAGAGAGRVGRRRPALRRPRAVPVQGRGQGRRPHRRPRQERLAARRRRFRS